MRRESVRQSAQRSGVAVTTALRWFQQVGLVREACHRRCLVASRAPQCIRFASVVTRKFV